MRRIRPVAISHVQQPMPQCKINWIKFRFIFRRILFFSSIINGPNMDVERHNHACGIFESNFHSGRPLLVVTSPKGEYFFKKHPCHFTNNEF